LTREKLQTAFHKAAVEGSANIIDFFFRSLKAAGNTNIIKIMLLHNKSYGETAWHAAARRGHIKTLGKLWIGVENCK
jgi:ankyrin repeat protein